MPKILYLVLTSDNTYQFLRSALTSWINHVPLQDDVAFLGNDSTFKRNNRILWPCQQKNKESRLSCSVKIVTALRMALANRDWDFVFRCDDDSFVVPQRLSAYAAEYSPNSKIYSGMALRWPEHNAPADVLQAFKEVTRRYDYAQGGGGYLLSRPAIIDAWENLTSFHAAFDWVDDVLIGAAMAKSDIPLIHSPRFGSNKEHGRTLNGGMLPDQITVHKVDPEDFDKLQQRVDKGE